ncbi:cholecystokinin receptor-like [Schistocerca gregaria]|uniref:cholecystokinin receptor-like n=1 Tax=Schistocerca gregaria TaxID=7010 RepID=UPI00211F1204|nr:cholecystokinin receptor-like [Schistocerca gregaria]
MISPGSDSPPVEYSVTYCYTFRQSLLDKSEEMLDIISVPPKKQQRICGQSLMTGVVLLLQAVSDLLLGVFCMPFTLVGQLLRNFIFGSAMCRLISYFQAVSVSVGVWTLVAISLERYFAICRPLKSRRWQTQFHAYKMIAVVWVASLGWSSPVLLASRLQPMRDKGKHKCREEWPTEALEHAYNLFLDAMLLLVPLLIMSLAYSLIVSKLWKGLRREIQHNSSCRRQQSADRCMGRSMSTATDGGLPTPQLVAPPRAAARAAGLCEKQPGPRLWCMVRRT